MAAESEVSIHRDLQHSLGVCSPAMIHSVQAAIMFEKLQKEKKRVKQLAYDKDSEITDRVMGMLEKNACVWSSGSSCCKKKKCSDKCDWEAVRLCRYSVYVRRLVNRRGFLKARIKYKMKKLTKKARKINSDHSEDGEMKSDSSLALRLSDESGLSTSDVCGSARRKRKRKRPSSRTLNFLK